MSSIVHGRPHACAACMPPCAPLSARFSRPSTVRVIPAPEPYTWTVSLPFFSVEDGSFRLALRLLTSGAERSITAVTYCPSATASFACRGMTGAEASSYQGNTKIWMMPELAVRRLWVIAYTPPDGVTPEYSSSNV